MSLGNKRIMANNIKKYMMINNKTSKQICRDLDFPTSTFSNWVNARIYPRIDKIEKLANYFNCSKSDLVESPIIEQDYMDMFTRDTIDFLNENLEYRVLFELIQKVKKKDINKIATIISTFVDDT